MSRRRRQRPEPPGPAGFLVVDKPSGVTSHDMVDAARGWLGTRRVGHLGTLDPLATGVLPLAVREATKLVPFLESGSKSYAGAIRLGLETDTLDGEGEVVRRYEGPWPEETAVREALADFLGEIEQLPPMYSAVKKDGVPLHRLARQGQVVERPTKRVRVDRFELVKYAPPEVEVEVDCSAGTYVRVLAADLGARLGCGAHLGSLRRTRSGPFTEAQALTPEALEREAEAGEIASRLIPPVNALELPALRLGPEDVRRVLHGGEIPAPDPSLAVGDRVSALEPSGALLAVLEVGPGRRLRPLRVLRSVAPGG
ncbi:MAG: tRNA pseudouridine(55) synthase TruB [Myxococcota bacterium]|nr:tRNA pseudouridine(55) synthase TruB [Myxococcota bacterium]